MTVANFSIGVGADDGYAAYTNSGTYPASGGGTPLADSTDAEIRPEKRKSGANFDTFAGLLRWDTSTLDDAASVTDAVLRIAVHAKADTDSRNFNVAWYVHDGSIAIGDYVDLVGTDAASPTVASITSGTPGSPVSNDITLASPAANISLTSYSGVRIGLSGGQPTGANHVNFGSLENATETEPILVVTYTTPVTFIPWVIII